MATPNLPVPFGGLPAPVTSALARSGSLTPAEQAALAQFMSSQNVLNTLGPGSTFGSAGQPAAIGSGAGGLAQQGAAGGATGAGGAIPLGPAGSTGPRALGPGPSAAGATRGVNPNVVSGAGFGRPAAMAGFRGTGTRGAGAAGRAGGAATRGAAARGAGTAARAGGAAARSGGLMSQLRGVPAWARSGGVRGVAGRVAAPLGAMSVAQPVARGVVGEQEGVGDDVFTGAVTGGAGGATLGAMIAGAPTVGIGAPVGAAVGGAIGAVGGGIYGALTGGGDPEEDIDRKFDSRLGDLEGILQEHNASPQLQEQVMMEFSIAAAEQDEDGIDEIYGRIQENLPGALIQDQALQDQQEAYEAEQRSREVMMAAAQSWMAPLMQQSMARSNTYADQLSQAMVNSANQIDDPAAQAFAIEEARRVPFDNATRQAYMMQQMASLPGLYGYETGYGEGGVPNMDIQSVLQAQPLMGGGPGDGGMGGMGLPMGSLGPLGTVSGGQGAGGGAGGGIDPALMQQLMGAS